jgi:hypothetical protein
VIHIFINFSKSLLVKALTGPQNFLPSSAVSMDINILIALSCAYLKSLFISLHVTYPLLFVQRRQIGMQTERHLYDGIFGQALISSSLESGPDKEPY